MGEITSIRIPEAIKREMERHREINWSEFIRNQIIKELNYPKVPIKIKELVGEYASNDSFDKLWILHMFSEGIAKRHIYENANLIFGENKEEQVDEVEDDLRKYGFENVFEKVDGELYIANAIKLELDEKGIMEKFYNECSKRLKNSSKEVKDGVWLLSLYIEDSLSRENAFIVPDGFKKTFSFRNEKWDGEIVEDIVKLGIIYLDYYRSNAYNHWWHKIPDYSLQILNEIYIGKGTEFGIYENKPRVDKLRRLLREEKVRTFVRWMGGTKKSVDEYYENEIVQKELGLTMGEFKELVVKLVKENVLIIDYMPSRSRAGKRGSLSPRLIYKIPSYALGELSKALLDAI